MLLEFLGTAVVVAENKRAVFGGAARAPFASGVASSRSLVVVLEDGLAVLVERPRVPLGVHRHLEFFQLRVAPRVPLDHGPLDGFAEVLLEVLGEPTREIFELGRGKAQARVLVLPLLRQRRGVLAHLLEKSSHLRVVPGVHAFEALQGFGVALRSRTSRAIRRGRRRGVFVSVGRWARHDGNGERSRGRATGGSEAKRKHARHKSLIKH